MDKYLKVELVNRIAHKMGKQTNFLMICFMVGFCITLISATTLYSGESIEVELDKPYTYYSIIGNSTPVYLTLTQVGNNVTIIPDKYSELDSYEIIFFDKEKETITIYQSSGGSGGGSRTIYKDRNITKFEFIDRNIFINETIEVPGDNIEVEKIVKQSSWILWSLIVILLLVIIGYTIYANFFKTDERRLETYE